VGVGEGVRIFFGLWGEFFVYQNARFSEIIMMNDDMAYVISTLTNILAPRNTIFLHQFYNQFF
jgi:hypothetical protein